MSSSSSSNVDTSVMSPTEYARSLRIPHNQIESATNNFAHENLVAQTSSSKIYKGQLLIRPSGESVDIVVRTCLQQPVAFYELNMLKDLRHKNILPVFKISVSTVDDTVVIINKHAANGSLDKHLTSGGGGGGCSTLTWVQRLKICVGIARALSYLHYDAEDDYSLIHGNIKTSKILLDRHWEPKLHGFGFAVRAKRNQLYLTDKYKGSSLDHMDPAFETTRGLTNKSDVFSFGVVLFEVLFGMEAAAASVVVVPSTTPDHKDNWHFARMARAGYEEKTLDDMIDPGLRERMNLESLNFFSETAYFCLKEQRSQRPHSKKVLQRLERALELQYKYDQSLVEHPERTLSSHLKVKNLEHLRIRLTDIQVATDNFSNTYCIGSGGYGTVYKVKLGHFDGISSSTTTNNENKAEFPKKRSTVAIKRLFRRVDGQAEQGFLTEIELLSKCKHPNIVSLIGFCNEEQEMILVYEYASNGSLEDYLGNSDKIINLTWAQRIKICIDIAYGLEYLHKVTEDKECIIHRDIKSANILLDDKWETKIADFGLSKLHPTYDRRSTLISHNIGGTQVYMDPEYEKTGHLKTSSDVYSFGVVLCEIMSGNLAYDKIYNTTGLPSKVRQCVNDRTIEKLVDPHLKEADENISGLNDGLNLDSLYTFSKIASQCVAKAQVDRPTIKVIIKELEKSLNLQNNKTGDLQISLEAIKLGTHNFSDNNYIGKGRFWKLYEGEISLNNRRTPIVAKRFNSQSDEGNSQFMRELKVLFQRQHENIVGLVGYCNETGEKIIVYKLESNGTLDRHLENTDLTWTKRLKIGLDLARVLIYLHTNDVTKDTPIIHGDIKSNNILLNDELTAKLSNFEEFSYAMEQKKVEYMDDNAYGSLSYLDPKSKKLGFLDAYSDIYSLGVVLLEMLLGRSACGEEFEGGHRDSGSLVRLAKSWFKEDTLDERIFAGIKDHIARRSFEEFSAIVFKCVEDDHFYRPVSSKLVERLTLALKYQEDYEIWCPKLPVDYEKLEYMLSASMLPKTILMLEDIYNSLRHGLLFQEGKAWFSLGSNGKRNVMISAKKLSYTNRWQRKWRSTPGSRFQVVAKMLDISNLNVRVKIKPQLLLPGDNYGVHLVFKFNGPGKPAKRMYVNLKYKRGSDNLHSDFATWREDGWMMIELCHILNYEEDTEFEVLLDSFSRSYCGSSVYIEGIEFRTIDNASFRDYEQDGSKEIDKNREIWKFEEIQKSKEVQHSPFDSKKMIKSQGNPNEGFMLEGVHFFYQNICYMLSEVKAPYNPYYFHGIGNRGLKPFDMVYSANSRFEGGIKLSKQQMFSIKSKIPCIMLLPGIDYKCYLIYKLSEICHGLHCPVRVRNVLQWKNKEIGLICFRPPSPWNLPDTNGAPKVRADGWMEVLVWKFNSSSQHRNYDIPMYLKFITYEGTMFGLIISGLEIRLM